jgi:hypothetical protein
MSKYYCLVAGLPNIAFEDSKQKYSLSDFRSELDGILTKKDKKLIDLFFLKFDNKNLIEYLRNPDYDSDELGRIKPEEFDALYKALKNGEPAPKNDLMPSYIVDFIKGYLKSQDGGESNSTDDEDEEPSVLLPVDRLASLYYAYAIKNGNKFVSKWFEMNLDVQNMLTALTCRQYGFDRKQYVVGDNDVAKALRESSARDFGLDYDSLEYLQEVQKIAEEKDLLARERKLDALKWNWLEERTFYQPFDIENIFAYVIKLEIIGRWAALDKTNGEETFRSIVGTMKKGAENVLEEFKRNNEK